MIMMVVVSISDFSLYYLLYMTDTLNCLMSGTANMMS